MKAWEWIGFGVMLIIVDYIPKCNVGMMGVVLIAWGIINYFVLKEGGAFQSHSKDD